MIGPLAVPSTRYCVTQDDGLWWLVDLDGYWTSYLTWHSAMDAVWQKEAERIAAPDFTLRRYIDGRGRWMIAAIPAPSGVGSSFATWEEVALFLVGVRTREWLRALRRLEQALGLPLSPLS